MLVGLNGAGVAAAICQHEDARAHALALHSGDEKRAIGALAEESAAAAEDDEALGAAAAVQLAGFLLPLGPSISLVRFPEFIGQPSRAPLALTSRSIAPLLEPPLS